MRVCVRACVLACLFVCRSVRAVNQLLRECRVARETERGCGIDLVRAFYFQASRWKYCEGPKWEARGRVREQRQHRAIWS